VIRNYPKRSFQFEICYIDRVSAGYGKITDAKSAGELRKDLDVEQLVFDLVASEAVANVAALMEDNEEFGRARSTSLGRIKGSMSPTLPKTKRAQGPSRSAKGRTRHVSS
jgi:hypothetical protein